MIWSFAYGSRQNEVKLIEATPAHCGQLLAQQRVEAALVPIIEYQRLSGIAVVPDVCVGSLAQVRSVVLVTRLKALKDIRKIALDESSRTSAALVKIIFREFLEVEPLWVAQTPDLERMLKENDAALIIGDPAMTFSREGLQVHDLATLWRKYTGLGFVFAMWMISDEASAAARRIDFRAARDEGLARISEIIDFYQPLLGLSRPELDFYIRENISFRMETEMVAGLELYYRLAHKHGLIPAVKPLRSLQP